jgi:GNAT superfamily N-acetyltransferase
VAPLHTPEEHHAALRLRYAVMTLERGDERYADHGRLVFGDPNDDRGAILFGAFDASRLVGTLRLTLRRRTPLIGDAFYQWETLARSLCITAAEAQAGASVMDRVAVEATHRGRGVFRLLVEAVAEAAERADAPFLLGAVAEDNHPSRAALRALGFVGYGDICGEGHFRAAHHVRDLRKRS